MTRRSANARVEAGDAWARIPRDRIPHCDLCPRAAKWSHPLGGLRCGTCPRPEATESERRRNRRNR